MSEQTREYTYSIDKFIDEKIKEKELENETQNQNDPNNKPDPSDRLESFAVREEEVKTTTEEEEEDIPESLTRPIFNRIFGPMKEGSLRGSIFTMSSFALGSGCFSFAIKMTQFGCVWFTLAIIIGGLATYWSISGMYEASKDTGCKEFSSAVHVILGKYYALILDIILTIYSLGITITYLVIIYTLIGRTYYDLSSINETYTDFSAFEDDIWNKLSYRIPIILGIACVLIPLCMAKNITAMRFFSLFGTIALFYTILVVIIECPFYWKNYLTNEYKKDDDSTHANYFDITKAFNSNLDFFTGMATVFFSFACSQGVFPVFKTLKHSNTRRMKKVFRRSIMLDLIIYIPIAIAGFMTTPIKTVDLVIYRDSIFDNDIFMTIAKICLSIDLFFAIPPNFHSFRCSFFQLVFHKEDVSKIISIILAIITLPICGIIGASYKEILTYISLLGGFFCTTFNFLIPGLMIIKKSDSPLSSCKNIINIVIITVLCIFGYIGGIQSVREFITK